LHNAVAWKLLGREGCEKGGGSGGGGAICGEGQALSTGGLTKETRRSIPRGGGGRTSDDDRRRKIIYVMILDDDDWILVQDLHIKTGTLV
jgi:hypothetical protein